MGRVLIIVGALLMLVGIAGAVSSSLLVRGMPFAPPDRASLCQPGERLVEESGASTYTPGQGNRRAVRMFCVDDKGARREVTGDFVQGLIGQVFGSLGHLGSIVVGFLSALLAAFGLILIIIGAVVSSRRKAAIVMPQGTVVMRTSGGAATTTNLASAIEQAVRLKQGHGGDLADRLRQLGEARAANLITQAEHDRLREEILRAMRAS